MCSYACVSVICTHANKSTQLRAKCNAYAGMHSMLFKYSRTTKTTSTNWQHLFAAKKRNQSKAKRQFKQILSLPRSMAQYKKSNMQRVVLSECDKRFALFIHILQSINVIYN